MTISYVQAANPIWYIADLSGLPAGGGSISSFSSLNPDMQKPIYQDAAGMNAFDNPFLINMNGTVGPLYFAVNSADPTDNYFLVVKDSSGNVIWQNSNFTPPSGGGGGDITTASFTENLVVNNVMYRNITVSADPLPVFLTIAPGANKGLAATSVNPDFGGEINFIKNNTSAVDQITFIPFTPGTTFVNDFAPYDYLNYACTNTPSGETAKYIQFPITSKVQNLNNQVTSVSIWGRVNSGAGTLLLQWVQFFGDGTNGPSTTVVTDISTITLSGSFNQYQANATIPTIGGKTIGNCGNDGLFLRVSLPLDSACNIDFTKPSAYLGSLFPNGDYQTYDMIEGIVDSPRTGDIRISENLFKSFGWVSMNDGVIGSVSAAPISPIVLTRANLDTFPLYNLIWTNFVGSQTLAPMYNNSSATPIAYGSSSIADFAANNSISLTKQAGRLIAAIGLPSSGNNTGTTWSIGQTTGDEQTNQVANHTHPFTYHGFVGAGNSLQGGNGFQNEDITLTTANNNGGVANVNIQNPVNYKNIYIKL